MFLQFLVLITGARNIAVKGILVLITHPTNETFLVEENLIVKKHIWVVELGTNHSFSG